ncbi:MAG: hypothetical protein A2V66_03375 [Ignavibacteria bacterium RBG_13_36_8]|nr:MAG: hypothetical protein A2V66_03375 [Ignavibacteria bacterium RBG_13_36_8]
MTKLDKKHVQKILIIKLRGIGDVILSTIVIRNLLKDFPSSEVHYLTEPPSHIILNEIPQIIKVHIFNRHGIFNRLKLFFNIRQEKYDLILDFFTSTSTALICLFSGARYKAGFPYRIRKIAYNLFGPFERDRFHAAVLHLEFLKLLGISYEKDYLQIYLNDNVKLFAKNIIHNIISNNNLLVGVSPSGGWNSKKCDPSKFAEISDEVHSIYKANILILWGPSDLDDAIQINKLMKSTSYLAPSTNILQMASLISECDILISNDSGPMHISTAIGTPVLSLHGPTNPLLQGPYGKKHECIRYEELNCIGCNLLECPRNHECFLELPMENILKKLEILLKKNGIIPQTYLQQN